MMTEDYSVEFWIFCVCQFRSVYLRADSHFVPAIKCIKDKNLHLFLAKTIHLAIF